MSSIFLISILVVLFAALSLAFVLVRRNMHIWLWDYLFGGWRKRIATRPTHIMFCFVDHFEPHHGQVDDQRADERMQLWLKRYPELARKYKDADGNYLKHTWFYPYDELLERELEQLGQLCAQGLGEVEFHLHHKDDTSDTLRKKLLDGLKVFNKYGIAITEDEKITYGFIHGNWALDNSIIRNGQNYCGVNDELTVLRETGCYADFTFPAYLEPSQPHLVNTIFYAKDDPLRPKSHHRGRPAAVGIKPEDGEFLLIQGPMMLNWKRRRMGIMPNVEDGNIHQGNLFHPSKVDLWVKAGIHIHGKDDWIFIKIFTHGAPEKNHEAVLGKDAERLFDYLTQKYNDGENFILHFVTAREMYNIIKAAEDGKKGDPNLFRDYLIKPYKNKKGE